MNKWMLTCCLVFFFFCGHMDTGVCGISDQCLAPPSRGGIDKDLIRYQEMWFLNGIYSYKSERTRHYYKDDALETKFPIEFFHPEYEDMNRHFRNLINPENEDFTVFYPAGRLDWYSVFAVSGFTRLVIADVIEKIDGRHVSEYITEELNHVLPPEDVTCLKDERLKRCQIRFRIGGKWREILFYYETNANASILPELEKGYDLLFLRETVLTAEKLNEYIQRINKGRYMFVSASQRKKNIVDILGLNPVSEWDIPRPSGSPATDSKYILMQKQDMRNYAEETQYYTNYVPLSSLRLQRPVENFLSPANRLKAFHYYSFKISELRKRFSSCPIPDIRIEIMEIVRSTLKHLEQAEKSVAGNQEYLSKIQDLIKELEELTESGNPVREPSSSA